MVDMDSVRHFREKIVRDMDLEGLHFLVDLLSEWSKDATGLSLSEETYREMLRITKAQIKRVKKAV